MITVENRQFVQKLTIALTFLIGFGIIDSVDGNNKILNDKYNPTFKIKNCSLPKTNIIENRYLFNCSSHENLTICEFYCVPGYYVPASTVQYSSGSCTNSTGWRFAGNCIKRTVQDYCGFEPTLRYGWTTETCSGKSMCKYECDMVKGYEKNSPQLVCSGMQWTGGCIRSMDKCHTPPEIKNANLKAMAYGCQNVFPNGTCPVYCKKGKFSGVYPICQSSKWDLRGAKCGQNSIMNRNIDKYIMLAFFGILNHYIS